MRHSSSGRNPGCRFAHPGYDMLCQAKKCNLLDVVGDRFLWWLFDVRLGPITNDYARYPGRHHAQTRAPQA